MNERIKVAVIGRYSFPYTNKLTHYLSNKPDIDLHLITLGSGKEHPIEGSISMYPIKLRRPLSLLVFVAVPSIKHKLAEINPDVIHVIETGYSMAPVSLRDKYPTILTVVGIIAREYKFRTDCRSIGGIHNHVYNHVYNGLIGKRHEKYVISRIPNIIVQTSSIKSLVSQMTNSKIYVVPGGVEFAEIQQIPPANLEETPDIFVLAGLERIKGVDILLKSIPIVLKSVPNLSVYIGGSGSQEKRLKNLTTKLDLEEHVRFLGLLAEEKFQYYKTCEIAIVPSRWDCQPATLFEAMASGKAVIASNVGGIPDTVDDGETGFLFEPDNVEDLASKIVTLLKDDKLRGEMGNLARERAKEYDWGKIADETVKVYRQAIADFRRLKA